MSNDPSTLRAPYSEGGAGEERDDDEPAPDTLPVLYDGPPDSERTLPSEPVEKLALPRSRRTWKVEPSSWVRLVAGASPT